MPFDYQFPQEYAKVEVPYCYNAEVRGGNVYLERNPFYSVCDERKTKSIIVKCEGGEVKVYKAGQLMGRVKCERLSY